LDRSVKGSSGADALDPHHSTFWVSLQKFEGRDDAIEILVSPEAFIRRGAQVLG
jgi:hypothetical protein